MTPEADLLARAMLMLWNYRDNDSAARALLDEYELLVMDADEIVGEDTGEI